MRTALAASFDIKGTERRYIYLAAERRAFKLEVKAQGPIHALHHHRGAFT